ncbi:MAG: hypothetical protein BWY47_00067 [Bacteroidetes bacterium ADurb.Bin302]|nr:MAG: hypothetical protein BWY47_00067 [Bacteroidetes bacterium ADurb.Bin302]
MIVLNNISNGVEISITTENTETNIVDIYGYKMAKPSYSPIKLKVNIESSLLNCKLKYTLSSYTVRNSNLSENKEIGIKSIVVDENKNHIEITFIRNYQVFIFEGILLINNKNLYLQEEGAYFE